MSSLFGRELPVKSLLPYVGDISQIARVRPYRGVEGHEDQLLCVDVITGSGFDFTVLPGRGMDISSARYNGRSLAWRSATGDQHPAFYDPQGEGWLRSFAGGLLVTCGLTWMGAPCEDNGRSLGLHGRASHLPAYSVHWEGRWEGDRYDLIVSGKTRESIVFGENIELTRTIRTSLGANRLVIEDQVENVGFQTTPHMILYHCNIGFPLLDEHARFLAPSVLATPRDSDAESGVAAWSSMQTPTPGYRAQVFFHDLEPDADGMVTTAMVNDRAPEGAPRGAYVRYRAAELPCFTQWKMMNQGAYVLGMEPGNARVMGRDVERREGRLQHLEPGEMRRYHVELGVLTEFADTSGLDAVNRRLHCG